MDNLITVIKWITNALYFGAFVCLALVVVIALVLVF
jgi:hypothetical protein